jgi:hypothetical protein
MDHPDAEKAPGRRPTVQLTDNAAGFDSGPAHRKTAPVPSDQHLKQVSDAIVVVRGHDAVRRGYHVRMRVRDCDRVAGPGEHGQVVRHIAYRDDVARINAQAPRQ